ETDDRHMIAEEILRPGDVARRRCDVERDVEHLLVVVVARPQHHAMLAEGHRPPVMIGRDVPDGENRHDGPALLRPVICMFRAKNMSKYVTVPLSIGLNEVPGVSQAAPSRIETGGFVFDALVAGAADGPLVLLLHGFAESLHTWRGQLPALAQAGYRAVAPSQRGYSAGARPDPA